MIWQPARAGSGWQSWETGEGVSWLHWKHLPLHSRSGHFCQHPLQELLHVPIHSHFTLLILTWLQPGGSRVAWRSHRHDLPSLQMQLKSQSLWAVVLGALLVLHPEASQFSCVCSPFKPPTLPPVFFSVHPSSLLRVHSLSCSHLVPHSYLPAHFKHYVCSCCFIESLSPCVPG